MNVALACTRPRRWSGVSASRRPTTTELHNAIGSNMMATTRPMSSAEWAISSRHEQDGEPWLAENRPSRRESAPERPGQQGTRDATRADDGKRHADRGRLGAVVAGDQHRQKLHGDQGDIAAA